MPQINVKYFLGPSNEMHFSDRQLPLSDRQDTFTIRRIEQIDRIDKAKQGLCHENDEMQFSDRQLHLSDRQ